MQLRSQAALLISGGRKTLVLLLGMHTNNTTQPFKLDVCFDAGGVGRKVQHA